MKKVTLSFASVSNLRNGHNSAKISNYIKITTTKLCIKDNPINVGWFSSKFLI